MAPRTRGRPVGAKSKSPRQQVKEAEDAVAESNRSYEQAKSATVKAKKAGCKKRTVSDKEGAEQRALEKFKDKTEFLRKLKEKLRSSKTPSPSPTKTKKNKSPPSEFDQNSECESDDDAASDASSTFQEKEKEKEKEKQTATEEKKKSSKRLRSPTTPQASRRRRSSEESVDLDDLIHQNDLIRKEIELAEAAANEVKKKAEAQAKKAEARRKHQEEHDKLKKRLQELRSGKTTTTTLPTSSADRRHPSTAVPQSPPPLTPQEEEGEGEDHHSRDDSSSDEIDFDAAFETLQANGHVPDGRSASQNRKPASKVTLIHDAADFYDGNLAKNALVELKNWITDTSPFQNAPMNVIVRGADTQVATLSMIPPTTLTKKASEVRTAKNGSKAIPVTLWNMEGRWPEGVPVQGKLGYRISGIFRLAMYKGEPCLCPEDFNTLPTVFKPFRAKKRE